MGNITKIIKGTPHELVRYMSEYLEIESANLDIDTFSEEVIKQSTKRNIIHIQPDEKKVSISVGQIKQIIEFANQKPHLSPTSTVIIHSIDKVNIEGQNKLLKLVEEPPEYLQIFLLNNKGRGKNIILETILSRCQLIEISRGESSDGDENEDLIRLSRMFMSHNSDIKSSYEELADLTGKTKKGTRSEASSILQLFIELLHKELREELRQKISSNTDSKPTIKKLTKLSESLDTCQQALNANGNVKLILDKLFLDFLIQSHNS